MAKGVEILVVYDKFPQIAGLLEVIVSELVRKAAFDIQAAAASNLSLGHGVDTGFLKGSIYCVVHDGKNLHPYSAIDTPQRPDAYALPEVEKPSSPTEAIVAVAANYGIYVEFGTVHMSAIPYLTPAAELVRPQLMASLALLENYIKALAAL